MLCVRNYMTRLGHVAPFGIDVLLPTEPDELLKKGIAPTRKARTFIGQLDSTLLAVFTICITAVLTIAMALRMSHIFRRRSTTTCFSAVFLSLRVHCMNPRSFLSDM